MLFEIIGSMVVADKQVVVKKETVKASDMIGVCRHLIYLGKGYRWVTHLEIKPIGEKQEECHTKIQKTDEDGNENVDKNTSKADYA